MRSVIYGITLETNFPLNHHRTAEADGSPADVTVTYAGEREVPVDEVAEGEWLQAVQIGDRLSYSTVRQADGKVVLRLHGAAEFHIDPDLRRVIGWNDPAYDLEMFALLTAGNLLATIFMLRGEPVLHASAVEQEGRVLAFVADSGMGKSTLAALCCAAGARFVTDDVLRIDTSVAPPRCQLGASENRLRRDARELGLIDPDQRTSVDGRFVWVPRESEASSPELAAIVLPVLDRDASRLSLERLPGGEALNSLHRHPRLLGWMDKQGLMAVFRLLATVTRTVPVYRAHIPWGPPFDPQIGSDLLQATGLTG